MNFSTRLDQAMQSAGFKSQSALAKASNVSQTTINRLLKSAGKHGPDVETISKLAAACKVSFSWLKDGSSEEQKETSELFLIHVNQEELRILTRYRKATPAGQILLESLADNLEEAPSTPIIDDKL